jgi:adenylate cyclase
MSPEQSPAPPPLTGRPPKRSPNEEMWRGILMGTDPRYHRLWRIFSRVPSSPRCKMCAAPFGGIGGPFMRAIGRKPWGKNPKYCGTCFTIMTDMHGGAEIGCSILFADVRGSTALAEKMSPTEFRRLLSRFYETATALLIEHDAIVDKFAGDEVMALFIPALVQERHAARAIESARALMTATGNTAGGTPWLPLGAGIHTGTAYVGAVGDGQQTELTALGDVVNVTARLASAAGAGEILVTDAAAEAADLPRQGLEARHLELRGRSEATNVVVLPG